MAGFDDGEDFFSDDDLDALPQDALQELENNAIQQTQFQATQAVGFESNPPPPSSDYGDGLDDDDLDDAIVIDEAQVAPSNRLNSLHPQPHASAAPRQQYRPTYGREESTPNPIADRTLSQQSHEPPVSSATRPPVHGAHQRLNRGWNGPSQNAGSTDAEVETMRKKLLEMEREQERLKQNLNAKTGEIAIVRSKQERQAKEYEQELLAVRKLNAEKIAQQQKAIEAAKEAEKIRATELEFVKRDLAEEAEKLRRLAREKGKAVLNEPTTTPKKNKTSAFRDGFDDDEIQILSPSKLIGRKSNAGSPRKPIAKRKRKGLDSSPVVPLEVAQDEPIPDMQNQVQGLVLDEALIERLRKPDDRLDFLETILDHRIDQHHLKTLEEFSKYTLPGENESFASILLSKLPTISSKQNTSEFPTELCELLISLWSQCVQKKCYKPIYLIIALISYALELKTLAIAPFIIDSLLPIAQTTCDLVAIPRFRRESYAQFSADINVSSCLSIIHLALLGCLHRKGYTIRFWRLMRLDFVLMILSQHQPVQDFDMMLQLLSFSVLRESIGPITSEQGSQHDQIKYIVDRIALLLVTVPSVPEGGEKHEPKAIAELRLQILRTLTCFTQVPLGSEAVAQHSHCIGRVVKLLSDSIDALYDYNSTHQSCARTITLATRLLHHLLMTHESSINMQQKLSVVHGGQQKYLLALARLNFDEGDGVLDQGIGEEVPELAHELLELFVSPEEGEGIGEAFGEA